MQGDSPLRYGESPPCESACICTVWILALRIKQPAGHLLTSQMMCLLFSALVLSRAGLEKVVLLVSGRSHPLLGPRRVTTCEI